MEDQGVTFKPYLTLAQHQLVGSRGGVTCVAFSPDGQFLASSGYDKTIKILRLPDANLIQTLTEHKDCVGSVAFSANNLVSASFDDTIKLWLVKDWTLKQTIKQSSLNPLSLAFSPDGLSLACGTSYGEINIWKVPEGKLLKQFNAHNAEVTALAISPDGKLLASGSLKRRGDILVGIVQGILNMRQGRETKLWRIPEGILDKELRGTYDDDRVWSIAFSADGSMIADAMAGSTINWYETKSGKVTYISDHKHEYGSSVLSVAFSPSGPLFASGDSYGDVRLWSIPQEKVFQTLETQKGVCIRRIAFSPDGQFLASGSDDGSLHLWKAVR